MMKFKSSIIYEKNYNRVKNMRLEEYLYKTDDSGNLVNRRKKPIPKLAKEANITPTTIYNILEGRRADSLTLFKIEKATNGRVTMQEMIPEEYLKKDIIDF